MTEPNGADFEGADLGADEGAVADAGDEAITDGPRDAAGEQAVSALLAGLPAERMPPDVVDRLDQALRQEAAGRSGAPATTVVPHAVPAQRSRRTRVLEVAAGVALLGGAVVVGVNVLGDSDAELAVAPGVETVVPVVSSGTAYTETDFESQASALAPAAAETTESREGQGGQGGQGAAAAATPEPVAVAADAYQASPAAVPVAALDECLRALNPADSPELVDAATYEAQPALVVYYTQAATYFEVFAVGVDCSAADEHLLRYVRIQD